MPLNIPQSANYPSPVRAVPSRMQDEPVNGRKQIPIEIDWGIMGGTANCVSFNLADNATLNFEQITTLQVDNSQSAADCVFIWTDTGETITIPAGTPYTLVPVLSNNLTFFVSCPQGRTGDVTRAQLLNYQVPPADIPPTTERQVASSGGFIMGPGPGLVQVIPAGINGTLEAFQLTWSVPIPAPLQLVVSVLDGEGSPSYLVNQWNLVATANSPTNQVVINIQDANWRFINGVTLQWANAGGAGGVIGNMFASYKQP